MYFWNRSFVLLKVCLKSFDSVSNPGQSITLLANTQIPELSFVTTWDRVQYLINYVTSSHVLCAGMIPMFNLSNWKCNYKCSNAVQQAKCIYSKLRANAVSLNRITSLTTHWQIAIVKKRKLNNNIKWVKDE